MSATSQDRGRQKHAVQVDQATLTPPAMGEGCELPLLFDIGVEVSCTDGRCGRLSRVVMDPATEQVTFLVVARRGRERDARVVPIANVQGTGESAVRLGMDSGDLDRCRKYKEIEFKVPSVGWNNSRYQPNDVRYSMSPYEGIGGESLVPTRKHHLHEGIPFGAEVIGNGTKVRDAQGGVGEVDHVLVDCTAGHVTHVVIRHGLISDYTIVPVSMIASVDEDGVVLNVRRTDLRALPKYRPQV